MVKKYKIITVEILEKHFKLHLNTRGAYEIAKKVLNFYYQENLDNLNKFESLYKEFEDIDLMINYKKGPIVTNELYQLFIL